MNMYTKVCTYHTFLAIILIMNMIRRKSKEFHHELGAC